MKPVFSVLAATALLGSCAPANKRAAGQSATHSASPGANEGSSGNALSATNGTIPTQSGPLRVERLAALEEPWGMAYLPDGQLLITEKSGRLRSYSGGKLSGPIIGVPDVVYFGQGGLLDVAVDPDYAKNHFVYLSYAEAAIPQPPGTRETSEPRPAAFQRMEDQVLKGTAVARGRLEGGALHEVTVIWRQVPKNVGRGHFGGRLTFAPDSTLFIGSSEQMQFDPAQNRASNLGKIVRVQRDGSAPLDNPLVATRAAHPEIWSIGSDNWRTIVRRVRSQKRRRAQHHHEGGELWVAVGL